MKFKKFKTATKVLVLAVVALSLSACGITTTNVSQNTSSVFFSADKGNIWRESSNIPTVTATVAKLSGVDVVSFFKDPSDNSAVYMASNEGLYYTYNITRGWNLVTSLPAQLVTSVAVNPLDKCTIYAASANKLYRSDDCARTFKESYYDNDKLVAVNSVVVDHYNPNNIYIGTSRGEVIKSIDGGLSWRTIYRFDDPIAKIISSPLDSRLIFVATSNNKLYSFMSNTDTNSANSADLDKNFQVNNFKDLNAVLAGFKIGKSLKALEVSEKDGYLFLASNEMILRSKDDGISWENLNLIQPDGKANVNAVAISPQSSDELYYVTDTTFFKSADGGATWTTKKLPSFRGGSALLVDFKNTNNMYLGTYTIVPKK